MKKLSITIYKKLYLINIPSYPFPNFFLRIVVRLYLSCCSCANGDIHQEITNPKKKKENKISLKVTGNQ